MRYGFKYCTVLDHVMFVITIYADATVMYITLFMRIKMLSIHPKQPDNKLDADETR